MADNIEDDLPIEHCANHAFEVTDRLCGWCGHPYCDACLVVVPKKQAQYCKLCAMALAGIRSAAAVRPIRTQKEIRAWEKAALRRAERRAERESAIAGTGFGPGQPSFSGTATARPAAARPAAATAPPPAPAFDAHEPTDDGVVPPVQGTAMPVRSRRLFSTTS